MCWEKDAVTEKPVSGDCSYSWNSGDATGTFVSPLQLLRYTKWDLSLLPHSKEGHCSYLIPLPFSCAYLSASVTRARRP